jgi:hypothetical protein
MTPNTHKTLRFNTIQIFFLFSSILSPFTIADSDKIETPYVSSLQGNYPNPFNPTTTISFSTAKTGNVTIDVFNIKGQKVRGLVDGVYGVGSHSVIWNGLDDNGASVSSGIYFYRMRAGDFTETKKMMLMK